MGGSANNRRYFTRCRAASLRRRRCQASAVIGGFTSVFALRGVLHFTLWMGSRALRGSPPLSIARRPVGSGPKPGAAEVRPSWRFLKTTWFTFRLASVTLLMDGSCRRPIWAYLSYISIQRYFFGFGGGASFTELIVRQRWSVNSIFSRLQPDKLVVCHEEPEDQQWFLWLFAIIDVLMCLDQLSTGTLSET